MERVLITLPVYNESYILERSVRAVHEWCDRELGDFDWEMVIADNGSTDDTLARARALAGALPRVSVFHTDEKGRGQVLRKLWLAREADFYTYMDIDLAVELEAFRRLVDALRQGADLALGSRLVEGAVVERSFVREALSRGYSLLVRRLLGLPIRDAQCGFKGCNQRVVRSVLVKVEDHGWFFDTELIALADQAGFTIGEMPVTWVEARDRDRKSTVRLLRTIIDDLRGIRRLRARLCCRT